MDFGNTSTGSSLPAAAIPDVAALAAQPEAAGGSGTAPLQAAPAPQLLLFVGEAVRPEPALCALLGREGQRCVAVPDVEQGVRAAALARFDAVLVAASLVDGPAARAIERLSAAHHSPIVVLAHEVDEVEEIMALERGADLYLAHPRQDPFAPRRLRAHLRALLRRREGGAGGAGGATTAAPTLQVAGWTLHPSQLRLSRGARHVRLTHGQAALLRCLMSAVGEIVPTEDLLAALRGDDVAAAEARPHPRSLRIHMHRLRQRLHDEGVDELRFDAVRGRGYALAIA